MPNYVINVIEIDGPEKRIRELNEFIQLDRVGLGSIDFNRIMPVPKDFPDMRSQMEWQISNWGTKWNADSLNPETGNPTSVIRFKTAWGGVPRLVTKLSFLYPDLELEYRYASEDIGVELGHYLFRGNGVRDILKEKGIKEQTKAAVGFSAELWGYDTDLIIQMMEESSYK